MSDQSSIEKIKKAEGKKKSGQIIKIMDSKHADEEVICAGLASLAVIQDEDSVNFITHFLDHENANIRLAACKAGISVGSEYMKTRVQYQLSTEKDPATKKAIQDAFNEQYN